MQIYYTVIIYQVAWERRIPIRRPNDDDDDRSNQQQQFDTYIPGAPTTDDNSTNSRPIYKNYRVGIMQFDRSLSMNDTRNVHHHHRSIVDDNNTNSVRQRRTYTQHRAHSK
jgi:hypothetical protein